jgi:hypothetical protein
MYLYAEKHVSGYSFRGEEERAHYGQILELVGMTDLACKDSPSLDVSVTVAYWRKANQVHSWFVQNVQGGVDECQKSYVTDDQLEQLVVLCKAALALYDAGDKDGAAEVMTPTSGFFFGSQDIDEYYREDLQITVEQLEPLLSVEDGEDHWPGLTFYYQSSW